jgi:chitinase
MMADVGSNRPQAWQLAVWRCLAALALLLPASGWTQSVLPDATGTPIAAEGGFLKDQGAQPRFQSATKISPEAVAALRQQRIASVPHFSGSFAFAGKTFPYTVVGARPQGGRTTLIPTQIVAVSMLFEEFVDPDGEPIVLDPGPVMNRITNSPNFRAFSYQTGLTQFGDAVQRAQFFRTMGQDWHTLLQPPQMLKPVTIDVLRGMAKVYRNPSTGVVYAVVDTNFFISQLNTIVQLEDLRPDALVLVLTSNVFLAPKADVKQCCMLGFHTAFDAGRIGRVQQVQTLVWASWIDQGLLGPGVADVTPLSHEISEWMNNPFAANVVPSWQPLGSAGGCQSNLETADPVATLPNASYPVSIDAFTYHPQTQVLLPWFTRQGTQDSIDGAFSFPDESLVTEASRPCASQ